jgi:hypothetical protein
MNLVKDITGLIAALFLAIITAVVFTFVITADFISNLRGEGSAVVLSIVITIIVAYAMGLL